MKIFKKPTVCLALGCCVFSLHAQQELENLLDSAINQKKTEYVSATFKSTRIINGHSIERMKAQQLDVRIEHRFGQLNTGSYNLFGLDEANTHLGLDYGITDWLMVGVGRGTYEKAYDGFIKFSIARQSIGLKSMPVSITYLTGMAINSIHWDHPERKNYYSSRLSYVNQLLVARKFTERLSLELNPTFVHRNLVKSALDPNDTYALGMGGRFKLTPRFSFNAEYYWVINPINYYPTNQSYNPLSVGFDIDTGGHIFTLLLSNSSTMIEKAFLGENPGQWRHGDIHFGFNISRVFSFKKANENQKY
jgi:hypothetical protein